MVSHKWRSFMSLCRLIQALLWLNSTAVVGRLMSVRPCQRDATVSISTVLCRVILIEVFLMYLSDLVNVENYLSLSVKIFGVISLIKRWSINLTALNPWDICLGILHSFEIFMDLMHRGALRIYISRVLSLIMLKFTAWLCFTQIIVQIRRRGLAWVHFILNFERHVILLVS